MANQGNERGNGGERESEIENQHKGLTMKQIIVKLGLAVCLISMAGCIHHQETVCQDVKRVKVEFENDTAGRLFYEALSRESAKRRGSESETQVSLPIIFDHKTRIVSGPNDAFNAAVTECDTNQDGKITEVEARIFADRHTK